MSELLRAARRARAARRRGDAGFTLLEVVVSVGILIVAMGALLTALVIALQATVIGRANQQAGDVVNAEIEKIRSYSYPQITLATGDPTLPWGGQLRGGDGRRRRRGRGPAEASRPSSRTTGRTPCAAG